MLFAMRPFSSEVQRYLVFADERAVLFVAAVRSRCFIRSSVLRSMITIFSDMVQ